MKKILALMSAFLAVQMMACASAESWDEVIGQKAPEISLICADGTPFSLYEALDEKDLAVVCLFGSGCGACRKELRALDKAYRLYEDRVAVIGLSLDRTRDTPEVLCSFQEAEGLTFPLGKDPVRTARFLKINMYPAFMIVSAIGEVVYVEVNGPASIDHFVELFDTCLDGASPADAESDFGTVCTGDSCLIPEDV
ncbi:MAG: TlpA family protein disulfide reductase [Clostridia bacterium]|nr:TlpA family protein disulfide reductase [Clostridia bacterium]